MIKYRSDRERAKYAFKRVKEVKEKVEKEKEEKLLDEYESQVKSFPVMILQNGLGNAAAFAFAKSKPDKSGRRKAWAYILWHVKEWLRQGSGNMKDHFDPEILNFIENDILYSGSKQYIYFENETLALLKWLKRFAEGMNSKEKKEPQQEKSDG